MPSPVKVQADLADLIAALEERAAENKVAHTGKVAEFQVQVAEWQREVRAIATNALALSKQTPKSLAAEITKQFANSGKFRYGFLKKLDLEFPESPYPPAEPDCYDSRIKWLRMHDKPSISLTLDQFTSAMRGCW